MYFLICSVLIQEDRITPAAKSVVFGRVKLGKCFKHVWILQVSNHNPKLAETDAPQQLKTENKTTQNKEQKSM
jgi:hypothetical protein